MNEEVKALSLFYYFWSRVCAGIKGNLLSGVDCERFHTASGFNSKGITSCCCLLVRLFSMTTQQVTVMWHRDVRVRRRLSDGTSDVRCSIYNKQPITVWLCSCSWLGCLDGDSSGVCRMLTQPEPLSRPQLHEFSSFFSLLLFFCCFIGRPPLYKCLLSLLTFTYLLMHTHTHTHICRHIRMHDSR